MSYRRRCKRSRLCLLPEFEQLPFLQEGGHKVGGEGEDGDITRVDPGWSGGQRTSDAIEIGFALFLQGCAFFLEPGLAGVRGWK